jgi:protein-tyrosine phosphatase
MIDFHTHILNGIDDGCETLDQSIKMVKTLKNQGIDKIILTPHFYPQNILDDGFLAYRKKTFMQLEKAVKDLNVKLIPACEVYISKLGLTANFNKFVIKGTSYILIELPFRTAFSKNLFNIVSGIGDYFGLYPVIAHPERYPAVLNKPAIISKLINMGCLIQLNASSLFNKQTRRLAYKMLEANQVHCIGSDCHAKRPSMYDKAKDEIEKYFGKEYFNKLQENMNNIIENKLIEVKTAKPIKKLFGFYI